MSGKRRAPRQPARVPAASRFATLGRLLRSRVLRLLGLVAAVGLALLLVLQFWYFAHILYWRTHEVASTAFMREQLAQLRERDPKATLQHRWVSYPRISNHLKRAVIAAEDAKFTEHEGVDWDAIEKALEQNLKRGTVVRGGSTITMQLAKNLFLSGERSYLRKVQELVITYMIEALMSKQRILEIYLNVAEWGVGVFGADAAARHYYGVSASQLSASQAARLAAMLPRPRYYDRNRGSAALERRAAIIGRWMPSVAPP